jgi:hypothetical protein
VAVLDWPDLGVIDVPEGSDMTKVSEAAKRFVRTTKTTPAPQPMTSAQMASGTSPTVQPMSQTVPAPTTIQNAIPSDAGLRPQTTMDQLRQYRDTMGRLIAPAVGMNFDEMSADAAKGILRAMVAYHGSPHTFDQFDTSKIGTGEGAQVYGHGLYFAENPDVAKMYQQKFSDFQDPQKVASALYENLDKDAQGRVALGRNQARLSENQLVDQVKRHWAYDNAGTANWDDFSQFVSPDVKKSVEQKLGGKLYNVTIPDEHIAKMLDWDKPLSEQAPEVQKALEQYYRMPIDKIGNHVSNLPIDNRVGTQNLAAAGIPGIKYLDQGSRTAGQGTRNFVVFDPSILQDVKRQ